jgi:hypothetical protein
MTEFSAQTNTTSTSLNEIQANQATSSTKIKSNKKRKLIGVCNKKNSLANHSISNASGSNGSVKHNRHSTHVFPPPLTMPLPVNPFLGDYIDCIENLPNRIQLLLSELRNVDIQVRGECRVYFSVLVLI